MVNNIFPLARIVQALNDLAETLVLGPDGRFENVRRNVALVLQALQPQKFSGITFSGIVEKHDGASLVNNSISIRKDSFSPNTLSTSLIMSQTIFNELTLASYTGSHTVIFVFYWKTHFFATLANATSLLNSFVIAGNIKGASVANLSMPVKIVFKSIFQGDAKSTLCSFWDFSLQDWSQEGCWFERVLKDGRILCNCNHLTNFAMLMVSHRHILLIKREAISAL